MCNLKDILFSVEKKQVTGYACNSDYAFDIFAYPTIDGDVTKLRVNSCSDRYELVPNADIFPNIRQVLATNGIEFEEKYHMIDHSRFYADYRITDKRFAYQIKGSKGDVICPLIKVQHSYNGLTKYKIHFGYFRFICSNGMVIAVEEMKEFNLSIAGKHTKAIKQSFSKLDEKLKYFVENREQITSAITGKYNALASKEVVNVEERLTEVLAQIDLKPFDRKVKGGGTETIFPAFDTAMESILSEIDLYGGVTNDWLIYNGINRYIFDEQFKAAPEARTDRDSKVFEYMLAH